MPATVTNQKRISIKGRLAQVFWLGFLVVSLGYAWYSFYAPPNEIAWMHNPSEAQAAALEQGKPLVYFVTATWCSPCRVMKRQVWADDEVREAVNAGFVPVLVDLDDPDSDQIQSHFQISGTPWTIFTSPAGDVLDYRAGAISKSEFMAMLASVVPS